MAKCNFDIKPIYEEFGDIIKKDDCDNEPILRKNWDMASKRAKNNSHNKPVFRKN